MNKDGVGDSRLCFSDDESEVLDVTPKGANDNVGSSTQLGEKGDKGWILHEPKKNKKENAVTQQTPNPFAAMAEGINADQTKKEEIRARVAAAKANTSDDSQNAYLTAKARYAAEALGTAETMEEHNAAERLADRVRREFEAVKSRKGQSMEEIRVAYEEEVAAKAKEVASQAKGPVNPYTSVPPPGVIPPAMEPDLLPPEDTDISAPPGSPAGEKSPPDFGSAVNESTATNKPRTNFNLDGNQSTTIDKNLPSSATAQAPAATLYPLFSPTAKPGGAAAQSTTQPTGTSMDVDNDLRTPTAAAAQPAFKNTSYSGVSHGSLPPMQVPEALRHMFSTKKATGAAGDKWLLSLGIDKLDGYDPSELTIDGVCAVFAFLQQFDPSIQLHCQVEDSPLPPLTVADRKKGFPTEIMMVLMYYFVERKWTLNPNQSNSSPSSPANKGYPNRVNGTLLVSSTVNLKELVEMASIQLRQQGLHLYWKQVQMKDSSAQTIFLGIPDSVNPEGLELTLRHVLKKGQDYLIKRKIFDFNRTDEPLPVQGFSFRKHGEQRMPPEVYNKEKLSNVNGYDPDVGIKLFTNEGSPRHWDSTMAPLFTWLEESGELNLIARRACLYEVPKDRPEMSDIISMQRNKVLHLKYSIRTNFVAVPEIATLEKEVELRYIDGRKVSPKFSTLREMMMKMVNPSDGRPLIESVLPLPKRRGYAQIMYLNRGGNEDLIKRMVEYPSAFWFHTWTNMGLTHDCIASLLDSFILEYRLFANKSTFDPVT